jgi:hypothetical protein
LTPPRDATSATHTAAGALLIAGDRPEAVANLMAELDHRGRRDNAGENPIARYLRSYGVNGAEVRWNGRGYLARSNAYEHDVTVPVPDPVAMFLAQFDAGRFPHLVDA